MEDLEKYNHLLKKKGNDDDDQEDEDELDDELNRQKMLDKYNEKLKAEKNKL